MGGQYDICVLDRTTESAQGQMNIVGPQASAQPYRAWSGVPKGIRTPVTAVKGRCPGPLDDGDGAVQPWQLQRNTLILLVVEPGGIEPPTSCMPCRRSP